mgnify:FL=1
MNNKKQRNRLFTMLMLVMAILMPYGGAWAQTPPSKGDGEVGNPYIITKAEELAWFRDQVNSGNNFICAKISDDVEVIDMSTVCHAADKSQNLEELSWEPIGKYDYGYQYGGTFDGNGKTITNLYINASQNNVGLFGYTYEGTIKNLTFEYANVTNTGVFTGILVGYAKTSNLQNIKISNTCQMKGGKETGGIAGELSYANAYNCVNYATVQGNYRVGGLFGYCSNKERSITTCANYGNVTATGTDAGGLVGYFISGTIQDCANYGDVKGTERVAGMAGYVSKGKIQNVFNYGNISATNSTDAGMAFGNSNNGTTEGMVAYYSGAKLNANGQEITIKAFGNGKPSEDNATGFTEAQLKSGEVAWLLNGSTSVPAEGSTLAWYQKLGEKGDKYPVLTQKDGNTVYNKYYICVDKQVYMNIFSNMEDDVHKKYDKHDKGTETLLADGLYSYTCQRCQTDFKYIKDFCGIKGNDLELTDDNGKYIAKAVTLTDGEAYNSPVDIEVKDLKYARTYAANKWQPLYVPFAMNVDQWTGKGLTVASINNFHETKLKSGETQVLLEVKKVTSGSLEPNIPYLILCDAEGEKQLELGTTTLFKEKDGTIDCHSVTRNYVFQGKYTTKNNFGASETAIYYGVKDGEMVQLTAEDVIGPQNWYLTVTNRPNLYDVDTPLTSAAKAFSIRVIGDGEATGIEDIHVVSDEGENGKQGIFDLQGRKLDAEPTHGIYIKNGKKYVK